MAGIHSIEHTQMTSAEREAALTALHPKNFGYENHGTGWVKEVQGLGDVAIAPLSWEHAQLKAEQGVSGINSLELIAKLQGEVWKFPDVDVVPTNVLSIVPDTGGSVLAAYDPHKGFTEEGWYGFLIGFGAKNGVLVSHMMGVREDLRGKADIGWNLKVAQAYKAVEAGHHGMQWTYDPMRGANARLNLEKLGGRVDDF